MISGMLIGMVVGIFLGMCIHREGCEWARRIALKDEKHREHVKRVQEWCRRQTSSGSYGTTFPKGEGCDGKVEAYVR